MTAASGWTKDRLRGLRRTLFELAGSPRYSRPSLNDLDDKLAPYLGFRNGFFVEAGANDGYAQSHTYYLERFPGWSGILVEGIPELYEKCVRLRGRSRVVRCALVSHEFAGSHVPMHYANLMSVVEASLKYLDPHHALVDQLSHHDYLYKSRTA